MEAAKEVEEVPLPAAPVRRQSLKAVFEENTATASEGIGKRREMPRSTVELTVDHLICAPGIFAEDFELKLRASTAAIEQNIAKAHKNDPVGYQNALARASLYQFNGVNITPGQDEWLWEALGPAGRNLAMVAWQQLVVPSDEAQGKAKGSLKIGG